MNEKRAKEYADLPTRLSRDPLLANYRPKTAVDFEWRGRVSMAFGLEDESCPGTSDNHRSIDGYEAEAERRNLTRCAILTTDEDLCYHVVFLEVAGGCCRCS